MKRMNRVCACVTGTLLLGATARAQTPYFVNDDAPGPVHDGTTWANAANYLRDALADAPGVIWVAAGTYRPDESALWPNGTDDRSATFQLINGKQAYGGFFGKGVETGTGLVLCDSDVFCASHSDPVNAS